MARISRDGEQRTQGPTLSEVMRTRALACWLPAIIVLCPSVIAAAAGAQALVGVEYVKALGQTNAEGDPLVTLGGQLALDEDGNLYCGTPGGSSRLQKLTPEGRVVWHHFHNIPGFQGAAVDRRYLYTCGGGYYGHRQLQRWERSSGAAAEGWQHEWKTDEPSAGVRSMKMPVSLAVDDRYLYAADLPGEELRRFDKATGAEAPFGKRVMVVEPRSLAITPKGNLLILTSESLLEVDPDGKPLRVPLIDGLVGAVSVAVDAKRSRIYVAEGGPVAEPVNRVRAFDLDGKPTEFRLGVGGRFHGAWSPLSFAFFDGTGAVAVAPDGGLWVNPGWSHRLGTVLPTLGRFDAAGKHLLTLRGVSSFRGITVDEKLDCYVGGTAKLSWDDRILWTMGLAQRGQPAGLPASHPHWPVWPILCGQRLFLQDVAGNTLVEVDRETGKPVGKARNLSPNTVVLGTPKDLVLVEPAKGSVHRLDLSLEGDPRPAGTLEGLAASVTSAALGGDGQTLVTLAQDGQLSVHALADGKVKWRGRGGGAVAAAGDFVFAGRPDGVGGVQVLRAADGDAVTIIGEVAVGQRPALPPGAGLSAVRREDGTYLVVETPGALRVYRL